MDHPLNILIVATKSPWPPIDGGRVVVLETLKALASAGHSITLVTPVDPGADIGAMRSALAPLCRSELIPARTRSGRGVMAISLLRGRPVTVVRHELREVRRCVAELVAAEAFDVVQAEQLQAVAQTSPARGRGVPVVCRAHNVESALWTYAAGFGGALATTLLRREARRLAVWEARLLRQVSATVVLTPLDLGPLREATGGRPVEVVPVPYPANLPPGETSLAGRPAVVTLASPTWLPSRETVKRIAAEWWPEVRRRLPDAVLHVFGGVPGRDADGVRWHGAPADSVEAFARDAVMAIPTRHPTGVPVKALEAWARGVPLVVSSQTAAALDTEDGEAVAVADGPDALAGALDRLEKEPEHRRSLVDGGRQLLTTRHDPARVTASLVDLYRGLSSDEPASVRDAAAVPDR